MEGKICILVYARSIIFFLNPDIIQNTLICMNLNFSYE